MNVRPEVLPFLIASWLFGLLILFAFKWWLKSWRKSVCLSVAIAVVFSAYFLFFFRDPERNPPTENNIVVSGADGTIASIKEVYENNYLKTNCVRISVFLSLFDVHVNRAPISGQSEFLGYFPGRHFFTFQEKSSDVNQHNKILITGEHTRCLVTQIVGPVCRRVVYWPSHDEPVELALGDRIGMMKFGSRLDMYFPIDDVEVTVSPGDKTRAGETVVAKIKSAPQ